jgi:hypothetical protein
MYAHMGLGELSITELDFEARAAIDELSLRLAGNADARFGNSLRALVTVFHSQLCTVRARQVAIDIRDLEFMNASCFNVLVSWVALINELEPEQRYELRFATNHAMPWQRRSLRTLSCFATDLVVLT